VGNTLSISKIIMTLMACSPPIMKQERQYLEALKAAETYEIKGKMLYIRCGKEGDLIFVGEGYDTMDKYLATNKNLI
jgi:heat shock protein HslJ